MNKLAMVSSAKSADGSNVLSLATTGQGPLSKEEVKALATKLDELIKFKNPVLEVIDGITFQVVFKAINDLALTKLPPEISELLADILRDLAAAE